MSGTEYDLHRISCAAAAQRWNEAAETARTAGAFVLAQLCTERATRLWYLAEFDPDVEALFNRTGKWA